MQRLHPSLTTDDVNAAFDAGAQLVWIDAHDDRWDAVLHHPDHPEQTDHVLAFLQSVNPQALDEAMTKGARLSKSLGASALEALISLAGGDERT